MLVGRYKKIQSLIDRIVIVQLVLTVVIAFLGILVSWSASYSSLLGGLVTVIAGYLSSRILFRGESSGKRASRKNGFDRVLYGQVVKLVTSVALFVATFLLVPELNIVFFFGTLVGVQLLYGLVPLIESRMMVAKSHQ